MRPFEKVASGRHAVQTLPTGQGVSYRCQRLDASAQWFKRNMPGNTNPISEKFGIRTGLQNILSRFLGRQQSPSMRVEPRSCYSNRTCWQSFYPIGRLYTERKSTRLNSSN